MVKVNDPEAFEAMMAAVQADNQRLAKKPGAEGAYGRIAVLVARPLAEAVRDEMDRKTDPELLLRALTEIATNALATVITNCAPDDKAKAGALAMVTRQVSEGLLLRLSGRGRAAHAVRTVEGGNG